MTKGKADMNQSLRLLKQNTSLMTLKRIKDALLADTAEHLTSTKLTSRLEMVEAEWERFRERHDEIQLHAGEARDDTYFKEDQFVLGENLYYELVDFIRERLHTWENSSNNSVQDSSGPLRVPGASNVRLQQIELSRFSGNYLDWFNFRDLFESVIHKNDSLSKVEKFQYLKSSLTNEALSIIKHMAVSSVNYDSAWKALIDRYENLRIIVYSYIRRLDEIPTISNNILSGLKCIRDTSNEVINALNNLDRPTDNCGDFIIYMLTKKLDRDTRRDWELFLGASKSCPSFSEFVSFLDNRINSFEAMNYASKSNSFVKGSNSKSHQVHAHQNSFKFSCIYCNANHKIYNCDKFKNLSVENREAFVKEKQVCYNCLNNGHRVAKCQSQRSCAICNKKHHTFLHMIDRVDQNKSNMSVSTNHRNVNNVNSVESPSTSNIDSNLNNIVNISANNVSLNSAMVLLATARVRLHSSNGNTCIVRALIDQGSECSFITESIAQFLQLKRERLNVTVSGVADCKGKKIKHAVQFSISPLHSQGPCIAANALVLQKITSYSPKRWSLDNPNLELQTLPLADPYYLENQKIDFLIGADLYSSIILEGLHKFESSALLAQNTIFGWILSGPIDKSSKFQNSVQVHHSNYEESIDNLLRTFWEIEEVPSGPHFSSEDLECEEHFVKTHSRDSHGRYIVKLPFKSPTSNLGDSETAACSYLSKLEKRLSNNSDLQSLYHQFLEEYEALGHMVPTPSANLELKPTYYLPHHPVLRNESKTTKLRVVFNASCCTSSGFSLNNLLHAGPKLQIEMPKVLLNWRSYKFVFSADIEKMFRQILVHPDDQRFQRILWRSNKNDTIQKFDLTTVTYGTASAPFLSMRVLKQLANDEGSKFPLAAPVISNNMYVDDVLFGADDKILALQTKEQVCQILNAGGFKLRKWASNCKDLLRDIDPVNHGLAFDFTVQEEIGLKILGLQWNPLEDCFRFVITYSPVEIYTKRNLLSTISKLYDPLGWLVPAFIPAKILIQSLWLLKIDWDDPLPTDISQQWSLFMNQLSFLNDCVIPRWTSQGTSNISSELHGFADASDKAYAAVVFLRVTDISGEIKISLLMAKSKVAPLKTLSIPRLELCAAHLLAKLIKLLIEVPSLSNSSVHCWTDSMVTLCWLKRQPCNWKPFVANRVSNIQTLLPQAIWRHVPTKDNPADCASRGLIPSKLVSFALWWEGPRWLRQSVDDWPTQPALGDVDSEARNIQLHSNVAALQTEWNLISRFSSWTKLLRMTAYIFRFVQNLKERLRLKRNRISIKELSESLPLSAQELNAAEIFWIKFIQNIEFSSEIKALTSNKIIPKNSKLLPLNPFLDEHGIIRLKGRLSNSSVSANSKFPTILPRHSLVKLIIHRVHLQTLHGGLQLTLRVLRENYWVLGARNFVKAVLRQCVVCSRHNAQPLSQYMGDLPSYRVSHSRPFSHTGVDYAGPINIVINSGRGRKTQKAYIAIFVCLAVRAIHLEVVEDLSTAAFLAAFDRFVSRRGLPSDVYSDNATNFQGADRELIKSIKHTYQDPIVLSRFASDQIQWHFIPPAAPHFGGLWEAGVKSVKHHLKRVLGKYIPRLTELITLLCQIECCLNSRPIAPLTDDPESYDALTPGHFLVGSMLKAIPRPSLLDLNDTRLSRWQCIQKLAQQFWRLWSSDYLASLQRRNKWTSKNANVKIGDLVLLRSDNLPPSHWELGRVLKVHLGRDGLVRVVTLKTASTTLDRPITKLSLLPISSLDNC